MAAGKSLPMVPLVRAVLFPDAVASFPLGPRAAAAIARVDVPGGLVVTCTTRDTSSDAYETIGCVAGVVRRIDDAPSGEAVYVLQGQARVRLDEVVQGDAFSEAHVTYVQDEREEDALAVALAESTREVSLEVLRLTPGMPKEAKDLIASMKTPSALADLLAANLDAKIDEKLEILSTFDVPSRMAHVLAMLADQLEILQMRERATEWVHAEMGKEDRPSQMTRRRGNTFFDSSRDTSLRRSEPTETTPLPALIDRPRYARIRSSQTPRICLLPPNDIEDRVRMGRTTTGTGSEARVHVAAHRRTLGGAEKDGAQERAARPA